MSVWRRKAIEFLPEEKSLIEKVENQSELWTELKIIFSEQVASRNKEKIRNILDYASWCVSEESGKLPNDTSTAVFCGFYEDIAEKKEYWPFFKEWFRPYEFNRLKDAFHYFLNEEEFQELVNVYNAKS